MPEAGGRRPHVFRRPEAGGLDVPEAGGRRPGMCWRPAGRTNTSYTQKISLILSLDRAGGHKINSYVTLQTAIPMVFLK